ncbi:hypothetical protein PSE_0404 [Pseudovibrio sp. FO-BEG1]|nr:hypothetical protein PSE_0404 [Pseudovibrio sp. FO-BEG1]
MRQIIGFFEGSICNLSRPVSFPHKVLQVTGSASSI